MAPKLKEPDHKPAWPPTGHSRELAVTQQDNWWTLAAEHGRADAWDLIAYNFNTYDPREVNWYLHHWVNCRRSPDGKNYAFGPPAAGPQHIYLPPAGWTPPTTADDAAKVYVSQILSSGPVRSLHASVAPLFLSIAPYHFLKVGYLVNISRIRVRLDRAHPHGAEYKSSTDTIIVSTLEAGPIAQSYVVHEGVHANFDDRRTQGVYTRYEDEEPFAYIVQMLYLQRRGLINMPGAGTGFEAEPIWTAAWPVAQAIRTGTPVTHAAVQQVKDAWQRLNLHLGGTVPHNGIR